jgi:hypothetical protein
MPRAGRNTHRDGEPYTDDDVDGLIDWLEQGWDDYEDEEEEAPGGGGGGGGGGGEEAAPEPATGAPGGPAARPSRPGAVPPPNRIDVRAQIEWAGEIDANGRGGVRTTRLDGLDLRAVTKAIRAAERAEVRAAAGPLRSYRAKGWHAQLRQLMGTKRGQEAARAAGLAPSRETRRRWTRGEQAPSKANRAKIASAYEQARNPGPVESGRAHAKVAEELTKACRDRYGVNVRFRDIEYLKFRRQ